MGMMKGSGRILGVAGAALAAAALVRNVLRVARRIDLAGRVVIVTGGTRGLGLLLAEEVGRCGAKVAICGRDADAVSWAERHLETLGIDVHAAVCDLGDRADAERFVDDVVAAFGRLDVIVNNAGVIQVAPLQNVDIDTFEEAMRSNFWSAAHVTMRALPHLQAHDSAGRIVNVTSFGGRVAMPHLLPYTTSKFAMVGFSEGLRAELQRAGVCVTTVVPGPMRTGSIYNAEFAGKPKREFEWFSVLSSLPIVSIDARRAARRIVDAMREGRGEIRLGLPARVLSVVHGLMPRLTVRLLSIMNRLLPPAGEGGDTWRGREIGSPVQHSLLLRLGNEAARRNNEAPPDQAR